MMNNRYAGGGGGGGGGGANAWPGGDKRAIVLAQLIPQARGLGLPSSIERLPLEKVIGIQSELFAFFLNDEVSNTSV